MASTATSTNASTKTKTKTPWAEAKSTLSFYRRIFMRRIFIPHGEALEADHIMSDFSVAISNALLALHVGFGDEGEAEALGKEIETSRRFYGHMSKIITYMPCTRQVSIPTT